MRFRELQGLDFKDPLDDLVANGLLMTARNEEEFLEIFGMVEMISTCQELLVDRGAMAQFFMVAGKALYTSRQGTRCVVEYGQTLGLQRNTADTGASRDIKMDVDPPITVAVGVQCNPPARATVDIGCGHPPRTTIDIGCGHPPRTTMDMGCGEACEPYTDECLDEQYMVCFSLPQFVTFE